MNQAEVNKLVSQLKYKVDAHLRKLARPLGEEGRIHRLRQVVTGLFKHERIELAYPIADEARGYAERLISDAIRHGDNHEETMEMADYWLLEKQLVHKLFKVFVPRYEAYNISYTRMHKLSTTAHKPGPLAVLELRGNPFPALHRQMQHTNRNMIQNVLLEEAKKQYRLEKYDQMAKQMEAQAETHKDSGSNPMMIPTPDNTANI